jgi:hypothetical protein
LTEFFCKAMLVAVAAVRSLTNFYETAVRLANRAQSSAAALGEELFQTEISQTTKWRLKFNGKAMLGCRENEGPTQIGDHNADNAKADNVGHC